MGRISTGRDPVIIRVPYTGKATAQVDGSMVILGATADTDLGLAIPATGPFVNAVGILKGASLVANDSVVGGTVWSFKEVELTGYDKIHEWEYDQSTSSQVAVASTATTTVTITSLEDNIDCSWLYAVAGTGIGKLAFLTASAAGLATSKSSTGWDSTTKVIKIHRFGALLLDVLTGTKGNLIKSAAAAPTGTVVVLETFFQADGYPKQQLNPLFHDNITLTNARFFARFLVKGGVGF